MYQSTIFSVANSVRLYHSFPSQIIRLLISHRCVLLLYPANTIPYVTYSLGLAFFRPTDDANTRNFNEHLPSLPFPLLIVRRVACRCILWPHFYIYFVSLPRSSSFKALDVIDRKYFKPGCPIRGAVNLKSSSSHICATTWLRVGCYTSYGSCGCPLSYGVSWTYMLQEAAE